MEQPSGQHILGRRFLPNAWNDEKERERGSALQIPLVSALLECEESRGGCCKERGLPYKTSAEKGGGGEG